MSKRILIIIESMGGGGAQQVLSNLITVWLEMGYSLTLLTYNSGTQDRFPVPAEVERFQLNFSGKSKSAVEAIYRNCKLVISMRAAIKAVSPHLVFSFITASNVLTVLASLNLNVKTVLCERNDIKKQRLPLRWSLARHLTYPFAYSVTANSYASAKALGSFFLVQNVSYLPNPVRYTKPFLPSKSKSDYILAVGRLHPQKGFKTLLEAFSLAAPNLPGWQLVILGEGEQHGELKEQIIVLGLQEQVVLRGYVDDPYDDYIEARVFVMPSLFEGSPNALWEAMIVGTPCIVSKAVNEAVVICKDNHDCIFFDAGSADDLAEKLIYLCSSNELQLMLSKNAELTAGQFSKTVVYEQWKNFTGKVINGQAKESKSELY